MQNGYRILTVIEFAFVAALVAAFAALGVAALIFGFQIGQWTEWQRVWAGMAITVAAAFAAILGGYAALRPNRI
jgi:hypothetical protein